MPRELTSSEPRRTPVKANRKFRRRELKQADGGSLVLATSGSITQVAPDGTTIRTWELDDADWARQALRFGVRPEGTTVAPVGLQSWELRPPRP